MRNFLATPRALLRLLAPFSTKLTVFSVGLFLALSAETYGVVTISAIEDENDVIFSVDGSVDLTGINHSNPPSPFSGIVPISGIIANFRVGDDVYQLSESVPTFGTGSSSTPDKTSGDNFGVGGTDLVLPQGYTNEVLNGSMTFSGETFKSLGIASGANYTRTLDLGSGNTGTLEFTTVAIPEPNRYGVLLGAAGLATAVFFRRRRRSSAS
jgi:hypothetical protein